MTERARIRRPAPVRTAPIRNLSGLWGSVPPAAPEGGGPFAGGGSSPAQDAVSRGVDLGYRVIDEYLRQGLHTARSFSRRSGPEANAGEGLQDAWARMLSVTSELSSVWLSMLMNGVAGGGGFARAATPPPPPDRTPATSQSHGAAASPAAAASDPTFLAIDVDSPRAVEVTVDVRSCPPGASLRAQELRAAEPDCPPLREVSLARSGEDGPLRIRIRFPPTQPPGVYVGAIVAQATHLPCGTLCVRIAE